MLRKDLDKIFTKKVSEYINKGFTIHSYSMGGTQGEIAKVDLTDGKKVYRIYMDESNERINGDYFDSIHLIVGISDTELYTDRTIWDSKLLEIENTIYFVHENYITTDIDEIKEIQKKHYERLGDHKYGSESFEITSKAYKIALRKINSMKGYKSIKKITKLVKYKTMWDDHYKYSAECISPSGDRKCITLW